MYSPLRAVGAAIGRAVFGRPTGNVVLMYHRISRTYVDPWALCVNPANFAEQMNVLNTLANPASLDQLLEAQPGEPSVAVTFDDGYVDNLDSALPILQRHDVPATIFVSTGYIGMASGYWWDELEAIFLAPGLLPSNHLKLSIGERSHCWQIDPGDLQYGIEDCATHRGWIAWKHPAPTSRHAVFHQVWNVLRQLKPEQRIEAISRIRDWAGSAGDRSSARCMTAEELREISRGSLVRVGSHTITHSRLSQLSDSNQWKEITGSKATLEEILEQPVESFSYPFGDRNDYTNRTVAAVRNAGYRQACSNFEGAVGRSSDRFQLPRLHVQDWNGREFEAWLRPYLAL